MQRKLGLDLKTLIYLVFFPNPVSLICFPNLLHSSKFENPPMMVSSKFNCCRTFSLLMGHPSFEAMITTIMFVNDKDMFLQQKQPQF